MHSFAGAHAARYKPLAACSTLGAILQGRGKKDAKQVSAAAVLEMLLVNVPESDFLMPGKAKQTKTVQPSLRVGRQADFGRGRGRVRPSGGRYMSQRSMGDYNESQLVPQYNEAAYYGIDAGAGYVNNNVGFAGGNPPPQPYHLGQQQQQQPQGFGMNVNGGMVSSGPLGHIGDNRGMPAQFQQVGVVACFLLACRRRQYGASCPQFCLHSHFQHLFILCHVQVLPSCCSKKVHTAFSVGVS